MRWSASDEIAFDAEPSGEDGVYLIPRLPTRGTVTIMIERRRIVLEADEKIMRSALDLEAALRVLARRGNLGRKISLEILFAGRSGLQLRFLDRARHGLDGLGRGSQQYTHQHGQVDEQKHCHHPYPGRRTFTPVPTRRDVRELRGAFLLPVGFRFLQCVKYERHRLIQCQQRCG